jgi:pimeloyl-ACP methyl ester carboxylesterase
MASCLLLLTFVLALLNFSVAELSNFEDWYHQRIQRDDVSIHFRYFGSGPPILLVHGFPQHSLTWHTIGPILAQNYTVIAPDNRGCGDSSLSKSADYTAFAGGSDLKAILDFLSIKETYVFAHDKGVGLATSLAIEHPEVVKRIILAEYPLPGYGYSTNVTSPDLYLNWQLAFFAVPDAAEFFISGKEKQMLSWYFFHSSYSGTTSLTEDHLNQYTTQISKSGFLRSGMMYFAAAWKDEAYFTSAFSGRKRLHMPMLALGGEASFSPVSALRSSWSGVSESFVAESIPKAGHWIGECSSLQLYHLSCLVLMKT